MHLSFHWRAFFVIPLKMPNVHLKEKSVKKELHNEIFFELQAMSYWLNRQSAKADALL